MRRLTDDHLKLIALLYRDGRSAQSIGTALAVPPSTVLYTVRRLGIARNTISRLDEHFSFRPLRPDTAWLLGLIFGDGNLDKHGRYVRLTSGDHDVLRIVKRMTGDRIAISPSSNKASTVSISSSRICSELGSDFGLVADKAWRLRYPVLGDDLQPHFVRGLLDSDGCWGHRQGKLGKLLMFIYVGVCREFIAALRDVLIRHVGVSERVAVGIMKRSNLNKNWRDCYRLAYAHEDALLIGRWLYAGSDGIRCERKYAKWKLFSSTPLTVRFRAEEDSLIARYAAGESATSIYRSTGVDESSFCKLLTRRGLSTRPKSERHFKRTAEQREEVGKRLVAGESPYALQREYDWDASSIYKWAKQQGIQCGSRKSIAK